jgi:hypothetical protein
LQSDAINTSRLPEQTASSLEAQKRDKTLSYMISIEWQKDKLWSRPEIVPYDDLIMHPFNSALHYAISCLDSVRAYKDDSGNIRLFRPEVCISRFNTSCWRVSLPQFDEAEMLSLTHKLVNLERDNMETPSIVSFRFLGLSLEVFLDFQA